MATTQRKLSFWGHLDQINQRSQDAYSKDAAEHYRQCDERDITTPASKEVITNLMRMSGSFTHRINALDIGCGSGRFFHALKNVDELTGLDLSAHMLNFARNPIKSDEFDINSINLIEGDCFSIDLPKHSFDFIYAVGVFAHPAPFDVTVVNKLYDLLAPGGKMFITAADDNDPSYSALFNKTKKRRFVEAVLPYLGNATQDFFNSRWEVFLKTEEQLNDIMSASLFENYFIWKMVKRFRAIEAVKPH